MLDIDAVGEEPREYDIETNPISNTDLSQTIRKRLALKLVDRDLPTDPKEIDALLKVINSMDKTLFDERKSQIEKGTADVQRQVADAWCESVKSMGNANPFKRKSDGSIDGVELPIPTVDPNKLGEFEEVEGEDVIGIISETSDEFTARMKAAQPDDDDDD